MIVAHPGHELRLFGWLELVRPALFVITDGSGSGRSRVASTFDLLRETGSSAGSVLGAFTDVEIYDALLHGEVSAVAAATMQIGDELAERRVRTVIADAFEFYNPTHDLCSVVATLAALGAEAATGTRIARYDYAVVLATSGDGETLRLDPEHVERKLAAAYRFENLAFDVVTLLAEIGREELGVEILRPVPLQVELPVATSKPFYETHGEERVAAGRYGTVLRYEEHFIPFVQKLMAELGHATADCQPGQTVAR